MDVKNTKNCETFTATIYLTGDVNLAYPIIKKFCEKGLCVTITQTTYIYTNGSEQGYIVGLINYPRFIKSKDEIESTSIELAKTLMYETFQKSCTIVTSYSTTYFENINFNK